MKRMKAVALPAIKDFWLVYMTNINKNFELEPLEQSEALFYISLG